MNDLRDMSSDINSLIGVKEKYKRAVVENYKYIRENNKQIAENGSDNNPFVNLRTAFYKKQATECIDSSLPSNERWGLVAGKNFFGISAELFPVKYMQQGAPVRGNTLFLKGCSGRFQMTKFATDFFPNYINITDILTRSEEEQTKELEEFYNMTNREFFEKFGVNANRKDQINLVANCVILDSMLKGRYSELQTVFCWQPGFANEIVIELADGTKITALDEDRSKENKSGITIEKAGKKAEIHFDAISMGENSAERLTNINDLEVEGVMYTGDEELIKKLQQAMQEQFKSQQVYQIQKVNEETDTINQANKDNRILIDAIIDGGITSSEVGILQQKIIKEAQYSKDEKTLGEN